MSSGAGRSVAAAGAGRTSGYRPDIDGLRALAILLVVMFHVGVPGLDGGFVGVDVFFAISGYLIVGLLARELGSAGSIDWLAFYVRRIRRLLPVLIVMLLVTLAASAFVLFPFGEHQTAAKAAVAASLFVSNLYFWKFLGGYFQAAPTHMPLLHTWSLSLEEQFYFAVPLLFILGTSRQRLVRALCAVTVLSPLCSLWLTGADDTAAFYLLPGRAGEFAVGALAALVPRPEAARLARGVGMLALLTILLSVLGLGHVANFPGAWPMLPACSAAALMWAGSAESNSRAQGALRWPPMVWIGQRSYSWYLWHFPALTLWRCYWLGQTSTLADAGICLAALLVSHFSYEHVEQPLRRGGAFRLWPAWHIVGLAAASLSATVFIALGFGWYSKNVMQNWPSMQAITAAVNDRGPLFERCLIYASWAEEIPPGCLAQSPQAKLDIYVWGDSHAAHFVPAIVGASRELSARVSQLTRAACGPVLGYPARSTGARGLACNRFRDTALARIVEGARQRRTVAVLAARWTAYGLQSSINPDLRAAMRGPASQDVTSTRNELLDALQKTIDVLREAHVGIVLLAPVPEQIADVPSCLYRFGPAHCRVSRALSDDTRKRTVDVLRAAATAGGAELVDPAEALCDERWCPAAVDGKALYFDSNHLSASGARLLEVPLRAALQRALATTDK